MIEEQILNNVRRFEQLEKAFIKYTYETKKPVTIDGFKAFFMEACRISEESFRIKNEILSDFHNIIELRINDSHALQLLDRIRRGERFYSVSFYESVAEDMNAAVENDLYKLPTDLSDFLIMKCDDLFSDFHSWFDVIGYYFNKIMIGPIISSSKVPSYILEYFQELREAFSFSQYRSCIALCRSLLEMTLFEKLKAKGAFKNKDAKITHIDVEKEDNLNRYINMAKWEHIMRPGMCDIAHEIRKAANSILHARGLEKKIDSKNAIKVILETKEVIESLYR